MKKVVILDLDGTLANTMPDITDAMNFTRETLGLPDAADEKVFSEVNAATDTFVRRCLPEITDAETLDYGVKLYLKKYSECFLDKTYAYEGIADELDRLLSSGMKLAVCSNKTDAHVKLMCKRLYSDRFSEMMGTLEGVKHKPDPQEPLMIASALGVTPDECVFVGDSDVDIKTAINAGMVPVGVLWGYRPVGILKEAGAKYLVDKPASLADIILNI